MVERADRGQRDRASAKNIQTKMKERPKPPRNSQIQVVSRGEMTADQQSSFTRAVDALLIELLCDLDRRNQGDGYGNEEQVAGAGRDRRRTSKQ